MAVNYQKKVESLETVSKLYNTLKQRVQTEQGRNAAGIGTEHTLQSLGHVSRPDNYSHYPTQKSTIPEPSAVRRAPHQNKWLHDPNGVEILHPFQRSGSARGPTSSEIAAAAHHLMPPPVTTSARGRANRPSATATPAQRVSLNHIAGHNTFPHTSHQPPRSHQLSHHSVERFTLGQDQFGSRSHHINASNAISPNIHARMPTQQGLY